MSKDNKRIPGWCKALGVVGGFFVANLAGTAYLAAKAGKKMSEHEDENNQMFSVALGHEKIDINPDTDYAYVNCINGVADITLHELPVHYDLYIELSSFCAVYVINLPKDVKANIEGEGFKDIVNNMIPDGEDESLPTVHIVRNNTAFTVVNIKEL